MISEATYSSLSKTDRSQLERIELARGSWAAGQIDNALLIIDCVKDEQMSPRVTAECFVAEAAFRAEAGDFHGSLESLAVASRYIDRAPVSVQGAFYHQRARAYKEIGNADGAFTDYAGAEICWRAIGNNEKLGAVLQNLAGLSLKLGDLRQAREHSQKAVEAFTATNSIYISQAHDTRAQILLAEGKLKDALHAISQAFETVGDNEGWKKEFADTRDQIIEAVIELIYDAGYDLTGLQKDMVRHALIKHGGNVTRASKDVGMSRKGVSDLIDRHKDLEPYRVQRRVRHKSLIKKS